MPFRIAILFGGSPAEYSISLRSAASVLRAFEAPSYRVYPIGVTKDLRFFLFDGTPSEIAADTWLSDPYRLSPLTPTKGGFLTLGGETLLPDCIFPVLHGGFGENGGLQGLLSYIGVPYVGCGIAASALANDKLLSKELARAAGIPTLPYLLVGKTDFLRAASDFGLPFFLKSAVGGSSVGAGVVKDSDGYDRILAEALTLGGRIFAEPYIIKGREIEASILDDGEKTVVALGEVCHKAEFYGYREKYESDETSLSVSPALTKETAMQFESHALRLFALLGCKTLARVDFFLTENGEIYLNEINTLPGLTEKSLYPLSLCKALGISADLLFRRLAALAAL